MATAVLRLVARGPGVSAAPFITTVLDAQFKELVKAEKIAAYEVAGRDNFW